MCSIRMPSPEYTENDVCYCTVEICNADNGTFYQIPLFVVLNVYGSYYFAPSFGDFDFYRVTVPPGKMSLEVLPEFRWPAGVGSASGICWLAAMTNSGMSDIIGTMGSFTFGWY